MKSGEYRDVSVGFSSQGGNDRVLRELEGLFDFFDGKTKRPAMTHTDIRVAGLSEISLVTKGSFRGTEIHIVKEE